MRAAAEADFWFYLRYVSSFGEYKCSDPDHEMYGKPWADSPFVFKKCRELQKNELVTGRFYSWHRFAFKTTLITQHFTGWELLKNPQLRVCFLTYKVDQTGSAMFLGLRGEFERNEKLEEFWPHVFPLEKATQTEFILNRKLGPREPSVGIHSLFTQPTSQHFDRLIGDDCSVQDSITTPEMVRQTMEMMRLTSALKEDNTVSRWIGTIFDSNDAYMLLEKEGFFTFRDHVRPYDEDGEPVVRSRRFYLEMEKTLGPYLWSAQMLGAPIARGEQNFKVEWLNHYRNPPRDEAQGKNVYTLVDFSGGSARPGADFNAIFTVGLGSDHNRYALDLVRERCSITDAYDHLFAAVEKWQPKEVWVESIGSKAALQGLKREMEYRGFRFNVRPLPDLKEPKETRIQNMVSPMRQGRWYFPEKGFGHSSRLDSRDTYEQLVRDELLVWTPAKRSTLYDDCIDIMAYVEHPRVYLEFPHDETEKELDPVEFAHGGSGSRRDAVSWFAF
jgi:hypothetical protein